MVIDASEAVGLALPMPGTEAFAAPLEDAFESLPWRVAGYIRHPPSHLLKNQAPEPRKTRQEWTCDFSD